MQQEQFFKEWRGKQNDNGSIPGQCVNVVKSFYEEVLGLSPIIGNAIDYKNQPGFIKKTLFVYPKPGDIVVFNIGPFGHIGVCNWWSLWQVNCFQQNDPIGSPCDFKTYSYKDIVGWIHPVPQKFTMAYTVFNGDPNLMEQARQLLVSYSNGKVDCTFNYQTVPTQPGVFGTDQQVQFLKTHSTNQFIFYFYNAGLSGSQIATAEVPGTNKVMSCATPPSQDPLYLVYEMVNALYAFCGQLGNDIYTPNEAFVRSKLINILPYLKGGVQ